jgi:hypothetical protein
VAIPCGSFWIYVFGWNLAGVGAQTEIERCAIRKGIGLHDPARLAFPPTSIVMAGFVDLVLRVTIL